MAWNLWDWFFGGMETTRLLQENSILKEQHEEDLAALVTKHNNLTQETLRCQVAEHLLANCRAQWGSIGKLNLQPIIIYPPGTQPVPVEPVVKAFEQARDWVATELKQSVFNLLPLQVVWTRRLFADFQSNMVAECRSLIWEDLKMPLPPAPNPHVVCLVRGMGGWAQTVAADWQAPLVCLGDACLEALAGLQRPYAMDALHPDWPEAWKTREGQMGALAHELCWHGLAKNREGELGYTAEGHPQPGSAEEASVSGLYGPFPAVHFTEQERAIIIENINKGVS